MIKKRIALITLVAVMALGLIACGDKSKESIEVVNVTTSVSSTQSSNETNADSSTEGNVQGTATGHDWPYMEKGVNGSEYVVEAYGKCEDLTNWGTYTNFLLRDNWVYIKFPSLIPTGTNNVAYQSDDTVVLFRQVSESDYADQITDLESIVKVSMDYPDDFHSPIKLMKKYWKLHDEAFSMVIDSTEQVTVGQYDCCKYKGSVTYVKDSVEHVVPFVSYSSFTKGANEAFYWMVFDVSEDHSLGATIEDYAVKMGYTIVEGNRA
ncbi:hypothetical protein SAMN02910339_01662 [Lachnospiraceae bacterium YSD2013]|nr:hypothetical protein SAMN02910339_01662 [Lachnospiraceae bacterium YSD2013]